ncbi:MAG: hypothetical protein DRI57_21115, partial [Deltaproteobacteria bacterium]
MNADGLSAADSSAFIRVHPRFVKVVFPGKIPKIFWPGTYPIKFVAFKLPKTMDEATTETKELRKQCDALFMANLEGLPGEDGKPMTKKDIIPVLAGIFGIVFFKRNIRRIFSSPFLSDFITFQNLYTKIHLSCIIIRQ